MIQTDIHYELTDTFNGEANYSWVKRGKIECKPGENYSDLAAVRRVKAALDVSGVRSKTTDYGDWLEIRFPGQNIVCFVNFYPHGSAS